MAVASAKASNDAISPTHTVSIAACSAATAISTASSSGRSSQYGRATPTSRDHSIAVSVGWSSSRRPVSSQVAGLT
jgi:hypothetical protein